MTSGNPAPVKRRLTPRPGKAPSAPPQRWCIITCEYPPMLGGVSDHTFLLARALVEAGDSVTVWMPPALAAPEPLSGVEVHVLPSLFGLRALRQLYRALRELPHDTRVLVQYTPTGYGMRGMNVPFAVMLYSLRDRGLDVYFHDVGFRLSWGASMWRNASGVVHLLMNWLSLLGAARVYIAIPEWQRRLRRLEFGVSDRERLIIWIPVPSNVPDITALGGDGDLRATLLPSGARSRVGPFGTYGRYHLGVLQPTFIRILDVAPDRVVVLVGRNGGTLRDAILAQRPDLAARLIATGGLRAEEVSNHLAACDVLVQPYDDGASARRGSLMAGLALGKPVVTNRGSATGPLWLQRDIVHLTPSADPVALARAVDALLEDPVRRVKLGASARVLHNELFAFGRGVTRLRNATSYRESPPRALHPRSQFEAREELAPSSSHVPDDDRGARVLMLHTTLPTPLRKPGGVEVAVHRLASALVEIGVPVTVASLSDAPLGATYRHRRLFRRLTWIRDTHIGRLLVLPVLLNLIRVGDSDVVHFHGDDWFVLRRPRATVRTIHGSTLREAQRATRWQRRLLQYAVYPLERLAARLATVSVAVGEDAANLHGVERVIGNGVDAALFSPGDKSAVPQVLYVGTWEGRKRGRWMYDLFTQYIVPRHPTVELRFIADVAPPSHPRVRFEQFPDDAALAQAYREAWVFALPSTYEGFGIPYLEAMASGTPVLATPNTGAAHLLGNGRFGVLADDGVYGDALLRLLHDDDTRARLATAGLERSREFSWTSVARAYVDVYTDAIRIRHGIRPYRASGASGGMDSVTRAVAPIEPPLRRVRTGVQRGLMRLSSRHWLAWLGEDRLHRWYARLLEDAASAIDVGAGDGSALVFAMSRSGIKQLVAFEPDRRRRDLIRRVLAPNGLATDPRLALRSLSVGAAEGDDATTLDALIPEMRWPLVVRVAAAAPAALDGAASLIAQDSTRWMIGVTPDTVAGVTEQFRGAGYTTRVVRTGLLKHTRRWLLAWHAFDRVAQT